MCSQEEYRSSPVVSLKTFDKRDFPIPSASSLKDEIFSPSWLELLKNFENRTGDIS
jgi:hypothetical protein